MVMEYVEGMPLMKYVKKSQPISKEQFKRWAGQLTVTLMAFHSHSVVFMDLNPNNIIITNDGRDIKLIDFGLAREFGRGEDGRETFCGTPYYASPENAQRYLSRSGHLFQPSSDWFALGISLYRAATLKHLYHFKMLKCLSKRDPYFAMSKLFENICKGFEIADEDKEGNDELMDFIGLITVHDPEARSGTNMDSYHQILQSPLFADYKSWNDFLGIAA
jgi:serine/threonine protein kinase